MTNQLVRRDEISLKDRSNFAREWLEDAKAHQENRRVFSGFFSGYVALVAAASQVAGDNGEFRKYENVEDEQLERRAIEFAVVNRARAIHDFINSESGQRAITYLRNREVPEGEEYKLIGSVNDPELKAAANYLFDLWSPLNSGPKGKEALQAQALNLSVMFRKVRNRLFHGGKMNDPDGTDADLLERLNPILFGVAEALVLH